MIFLHLLLGIILGELYGNYFFFILGSVFADLDHLYVIFKHRLFNIRKMIESIRYEHKYRINYKTPLFHSLFGAVIFSTAVFFIAPYGAIPFLIGYLLHLLLDLIDIDEKYLLYPLRIKFKGFLPIWSIVEQIATAAAIIAIVILFLIP